MKFRVTQKVGGLGWSGPTKRALLTEKELEDLGFLGPYERAEIAEKGGVIVEGAMKHTIIVNPYPAVEEEVEK